MKINEINRATNPPSFVLVFELLTLFRPNTAYWVWFSANAGALAFSLFLLLKDFPTENSSEVWSLAALSLLYPPVIDNFLFAQTQIFMMLMLTGMMSTLKRGNDFAAGLLLAAASLLRIYPVVIAGYLAATGRWRPLLYTIMFGAIGMFVTASILGIGRTLSFVRLYPFLTGRHWLGVPANVSLDAFISRIFWLAGPATSGWEIARRIAVASASILLLLATVLISMANGKDDSSQWRFSLWVVAMVLVSPTAWPHYLIFLLIPFSRLIVANRQGRISPQTAWFGLGSAAFVFLGICGVLTTRTSYPAVSAVIAQLLVFSSALAYIALYSFGNDVEQKAGSTGAWKSR